MTTNSPDNTSKRAESESFNASAFSISLTVKDLATSLAWYQDVLGFTIVRKNERDGKLRSVALSAGAARISINQVGPMTRFTKLTYDLSIMLIKIIPAFSTRTLTGSQDASSILKM